jgi:hypothetical protein
MTGSGFKVIPFTVYLLPTSNSVSVRIKIVLMTIDDLLAGLIVSGFITGIPPAIIVMVPAYGIFCRNRNPHLLKKAVGKPRVYGVFLCLYLLFLL